MTPSPSSGAERGPRSDSLRVPLRPQCANPKFVGINHSPVRMPEVKVDEKVLDRICLAVGSFTKGKSSGATGCTGYGGSGNFHVSMDPPNDDLLLRAAIRNNSPQAVSALSMLLEFAASRGVIAPRYLRTLDGQLFAKEENSAVSWVCFPFIASEGFFSGTEEEQRTVGAEIGRLHRALKEFASDPSSSELVALLKGNNASIPNSPGTTCEMFDDIIQRANLAPSDDARTEVLAQASAARHALVVLEELRSVAEKASESFTQLIHRDLHPHNVLKLSTIGGARGAILDFDDVAFGSVYNDLGYALHAFVRQGCHHHGAKNAGAFAKAFLAGYSSTNPEVPIDGPAITYQVLNECFRRGMKALRERYVDGSMRLDPSFIRKHMHFPGEVLFIAEQAGLLGK